MKPEAQTSREYDLELEKVSLNIMSMSGEIFQETGVYATNAMQDGEAFIGLVGNQEEKLWEFECAIIPSHHQLHYQNVPEDFRKCTVQHSICYIRETL